MTYYEKLGVSKNATQDEIKEAYKNLIKKYHPDVYQGDKAFAEKKAKEINVAYDILSNPEKKAAYDGEINPPPTYTSNYNYTPPKYDTPPSNYNDYRKSYGREYNYNYQYTDYHRNKTPNSSYYKNNPLEEKFNKLFDTHKLVIVFIIFIVYVALLIFTFCQYVAIKNNEYTGPLTNQRKVETNTTHENTNTSSSDSQYKESTTPSNEQIFSFPSTYEEFDINKYISDEDLYSLYSQYFYSEYDSYNEFKEAISEQLFEYYSSFY